MTPRQKFDLTMRMLQATISSLVVVPLFLLINASCGHLTKDNVKTVVDHLDEAAMLCIMTSTIVDSSELADACKLSRSLIPLLQNLISTREGARQAGVTWPKGSDGGTPKPVEAGAK